jgi:hypothetical protein
MEVLAAQVIKTVAASFATSGILLIWFNTDSFVQYIKLFRLSKFTYVKEYEQELFENPDLKYLDFAYFKEPSFFNKLISCPYCLSFWISLISAFIATGNPLLGFVVYPISLIIYFSFIKIFLKDA